MERYFLIMMNALYSLQKGVIETVKKLNWAPDIIHVNGWLASLLPLYLKEFYKTEPLFNESKIVTSVYNQSFEGTLDMKMKEKVKFDGLDDDAIKPRKIQTI
jgi:starch synthase